ncbi:4-alpha-glucanotransferase [Actinotalea ferrariae CF5-4]|uniref:4-alpha-glucanotransferase n=1 Tax=Actinotalea ferrariae CF5-4 TaxID=948458 RepID=A0A021VZN0_9CELL|nr:4-alpha-glucanotransferase [Actinotalea ferrariae]EYR64527.1 4-alpha-glucanotransferase [Actinotalea ferrariae CF5-4]
MPENHDASPLPTPLLELAARHGVVPDFWGFDGQHRFVSEKTMVAVLAALGVDASTPERVGLALENADDDPWRRVLPPVVVVRAGSPTEVPAHVADGQPVTVRVELEDGAGHRELVQSDAYVAPRTVDGRVVGRATFVVPADLPLGWHDLVAQSPDGTGRSTLVVVPDRLELGHGLAERRGWGLMTQLYSVRSERSWGLGDLADLREMGWMAGRRCGADFLLINPLHAAEPGSRMTPSPYLPVTRRFVNPVYLRVEDIPETAYLPVAERSLVEWQAEVARPLSDDGPIDRDTVWGAKKVALEVVHAAPRSAARQAAFEQYKELEGQGLEDFATWCALAEHFEGRTWPAAADDRGSELVKGLREKLADRIQFHCWLQWVADEQLADAQRAAVEGGMRIGIMHDLAVGVHPEGADAWAMRDVLAQGVSVGAPPDMYNQQGQDWSQPPWRPDGLARAAYRPYRDMLRTILRHAGAIRIDHVLGLFRLWWIPSGAGAQDGAYVRYDHEALIGILCLEAQRAGAVVIGEDLGVFEPWVRTYLTERGILGTSVLWFEYEGDRLMAPEKYRPLALATVTTHDLPPTAGYLAGEHVDLRDRLGLLTEPVEVVRRAAAQERQQMVDVLTSRGLVGADPSERELVEALHRLVLASPSVLVGVSLADAVGERRAQNQPGTDTEYPNWKVPLADSAQRLVTVDDLFDNPRLRSLVVAVNDAIAHEVVPAT